MFIYCGAVLWVDTSVSMKHTASLFKIEMSQVGKVVGSSRGWGETGMSSPGHRSGLCYSAMRLCHAVHFNIMLSVFKKWQICFIFNYLDVHLKLPPWGRVHLEKLALDHLAKIFYTFSRTHVFIIVFAVALVFIY